MWPGLWWCGRRARPSAQSIYLRPFPWRTPMRLSRTRSRLALAVSVIVAAGAAVTTAIAAHAAAGCQVTYTVSSQWPGGFGANVSVNNLGDAISSWRLTWSFSAGQTITQLWNGTYTQSGSQVTVNNVSYNGSIPTGGSQ